MTNTTDIKALREAMLTKGKSSLTAKEVVCIISELDRLNDAVKHLGINVSASDAAFLEMKKQYSTQFDRCRELSGQLEAERQRAADAQTLLMPDGLHENTKALVIGFANAMAEKLYKAEQKYGWSDAWMQSDWQDKCLTDFNHHITKGDPLDVANYCAFMHFHGWPTALKGDQVPVEYQMYYHNHGTGGGEWCRVRTKARYEELQIEHAGDNDFSFRTLFTAPQKPVVLPSKITQGFTRLAEMYGCEPAQAQFIAVGWNAAIEAAGGIVKDDE